MTIELFEFEVLMMEDMRAAAAEEYQERQQILAEEVGGPGDSSADGEIFIPHYYGLLELQIAGMPIAIAESYLRDYVTIDERVDTNQPVDYPTLGALLILQEHVPGEREKLIKKWVVGHIEHSKIVLPVQTGLAQFLLEEKPRVGETFTYKGIDGEQEDTYTMAELSWGFPVLADLIKITREYRDLVTKVNNTFTIEDASIRSKELNNAMEEIDEAIARTNAVEVMQVQGYARKASISPNKAQELLLRYSMTEPGSRKRIAIRDNVGGRSKHHLRIYDARAKHKQLLEELKL